MEQVLAILNSILLDTTLILLFITTIVAFATGLVMIISPARMAEIKTFFDRQFSLRRALKPLDIPRYKERFYYRHHKLIGSFVVLGSLFSLSVLGLGNHAQKAMALFSQSFNRVVVEILIQSAEWFLFLGNLFALSIGLIVLLRPSLLKGFEAQANRWLTTRPYTRPLESYHPEVDRSAMLHERLYGLFFILGAVYIAANLALLLTNKL